MIEILIGLGVLILYSEFREERVRRQFKMALTHVKAMKRSHEDLRAKVTTLSEAIAKTRAIMQSLCDRADGQAEFITKASADLEALVKEYEINGVPLGYDRTGGKRPNFYEV